MKIVAIECREYTGTLESEGQFWEERLCTPSGHLPGAPGPRGADHGAGG